jgi:hypothetical protein
VSQGLAFTLLAALFAAYLFFGFRTGVMPTYLTGGASREKEPILFWMATVVVVVALMGSVWGAIASL